MKYLLVEDDPNIGRDPLTGGIVSLNMEAYHAHIRMKNDKQNLQNRIENIEKDVSDIKSMFSEILKKLG